MSEIRHVAVVGAGLMGHGIAQEFALGGFDVTLNDTSESKLADAKRNMAANFQFMTEMGLVTSEETAPVVDMIRTSTSLPDTISGADLVIEAVFEDIALKQRVFAELDRLAPKHTILASNTSTLLPSEMASATTRPDRVLVAHFFNPPYLLPLVEVVPGPETSNETVEAVRQVLTSLGKRPAVLQKEAPGFVVNRLQVAMLREAVSIVEQGIASVEVVDQVVKNSFGRRLSAAGPFEVFDSAGWDVILAVISQLVGDIESSPEVPPMVKDMVDRGDLGMKSGKGFYAWTPEAAAKKRQEIGRYLVAIERLSREVK